MRPDLHLIISILLAFVFYAITGSTPGAILFFSGSFLIDLDHLPDYWLYRKRITFGPDFFNHFHWQWKKVVLIFHSFDLILLIFIIGWVSGHFLYGFALCMGMFLHLLTDMPTNGVRFRGYILLYRILTGFELKKYMTKKQWVKIMAHTKVTALSN